MPQTPQGARKVAAAKAGITVAEYERRIADGQSWCTGCKAWHPRADFGADVTRGSGIAATCIAGRKARYAAYYVPKVRTQPPGPAPLPGRDGDKLQARARVNLAIKAGRLLPPGDLPCVDCGHATGSGERRHEYDHFLGYAAEHHLHVEAVCTRCHRRRAIGRGEWKPPSWKGKKRPGQNDGRPRSENGKFKPER